MISNDVTTVDGLAVDWLYNHIYWTNTDTDTIEVGFSHADVCIAWKLQKPVISCENHACSSSSWMLAVSNSNDPPLLHIYFPSSFLGRQCMTVSQKGRERSRFMLPFFCTFHVTILNLLPLTL